MKITGARNFDTHENGRIFSTSFILKSGLHQCQKPNSNESHLIFCIISIYNTTFFRFDFKVFDKECSI